MHSVVLMPVQPVTSWRQRGLILEMMDLSNNRNFRPLQAQIELTLPANRVIPNSLLQTETTGLKVAKIGRVQGNLSGLGAGGGLSFYLISLFQ